jgi:hypothetical protein
MGGVAATLIGADNMAVGALAATALRQGQFSGGA